MRYFVFVEFTDPRVRQFLDELRKALNGGQLNDVPHITVRGPYSTKPEASSIESWKQDLVGNGVLLGESDIFKTPKGYAVFLHAKSKIFNDIWWKPDYRGPKSSRKPHVTIFETKDLHSAELVQNFLNSEQIEIFTFGVDLTVYTSKQNDLLEYNSNVLDLSYKPIPQDRIHFNQGIFERGRKLYEHLAQQEIDHPLQPRLF